MTLQQRLEGKIAQALAATWEHSQPLAIRLDPPPRDEGGALIAGAVYLVQARGGAWIEIHREPATAMADAGAVDDFLARGLSILLMKHPVWPK